jgi:ATP-binding protein involved in chromosome partitioning
VPSNEEIRAALRAVIDPELRQSIVDLGMVRSIEQPQPGRVDVVVSLTTPGCPIRSHFQKGVTEAVMALGGVQLVNVGFDVLSPDEKQGLQQRLGRQGGLPTGALARVRNVVCVGSGKGGVGKSTLTANLAAALTAEGRPAAAMDADVWGYSIPRMLGVHGKPRISAERKILPLVADGGVKAVSIEFFLKNEDEAVIWRGPMLHKAMRQFLEDVDWGELDYLLIDLPPGTGDVAMTLSQLLPQARFVVVTTPQPAAQKVARRAAEMAQRFELEIAGVVENMSGLVTPGGERLTVFGEGGGQLLADELDVPLLGKVPLQEELRAGADEGRPLVLTDPDAPASQAIYHAARGLIALTPRRPLLGQPVEGQLEPAPAPVTGTPLPMAPLAPG